MALALSTNLEVAAIEGHITIEDWNEPVDVREVDEALDWSGGRSCTRLMLILNAIQGAGLAWHIPGN